MKLFSKRTNTFWQQTFMFFVGRNKKNFLKEIKIVKMVTLLNVNKIVFFFYCDKLKKKTKCEKCEKLFPLEPCNVSFSLFLLENMSILTKFPIHKNFSVVKLE